ncbi:MAG: HEAT repeat domain-containing protein, partial [Planctomycetota bacterium]
YLVQPDKRKSGALLEVAVETAGRVRDDQLVSALLKIVTKSKDLSIAAQAVKSLGKFGHSKAKRKKILTELVATVKKDKPGVSGTFNPLGANRRSGEESVNRWQALTAVLTPALNELTGRKLRAPEEWFHTVQSYKSRLDEIFTH